MRRVCVGLLAAVAVLTGIVAASSPADATPAPHGTVTIQQADWWW